MNRKGGIFSQEPINEYISHSDPLAVKQIEKVLSVYLKEAGDQPIVIVCIGTDRSTGDSLGPLVGMKLSAKQLTRFHVYGTLADPVHAVNLNEKLDHIHQQHQNPFMIAIDACLGRTKSVGSFQIGKGPLKPGAGVQKSLPEVGHVHINGIVNVSGFMEYFVLQNTRLNLVMSMANVLADGLSHLEKAEWQRRHVSPIQRMTGRMS
ncbi:spore protease YyaC [Bacillus haynesii]|uniref:Spore protease YyaC n=1 Tax=Bacillus haynesii TaxID=1925021 RepID=A0AA90ESU7_9BACI|nr:spore protease YyaC [Bacillus haynesii]MCY7789340.1 spore protease YyaC [Bacillus haynesii]MCY7862026.1 spore protease YyaC [Bacillus haynesii]MCY8073423.1 spore protease YyaC [Bacillus haynesii]MCY8098807.1 spore protease YyaC [Bacillus haynesii]MCY8468372.1 spore protease YyaC [Bacillus haynesii]